METQTIKELFINNRESMKLCSDCNKKKNSYCIRHKIIDNYLRLKLRGLKENE